MFASPTSTSLPSSRLASLSRTNTRIHAAFLLVAGLLSLQACNGSSSASPAPAAAAVNSKAAAATRVVAASDIAAGRYLVSIGGCNDCHTPGFPESKGAAPAEPDWLTGSPVGFSGPWGVSYPANLRLSFQNMSEDEFLDLAHKGEGRPPMPWPSLKAMSDDDLRSVYRYIRQLGPKGAPVPAALSPGQKASGPVVSFVPTIAK